MEISVIRPKVQLGSASTTSFDVAGYEMERSRVGPVGANLGRAFDRVEGALQVLIKYYVPKIHHQ